MYFCWTYMRECRFVLHSPEFEIFHLLSPNSLIDFFQFFIPITGYCSYLWIKQGLVIVKSTSSLWNNRNNRLMCGRTLCSRWAVAIGRWVFTNFNKPTAVGSPHSEASLNKLMIKEGSIQMIAAIAASWDSHLTSLASFSLTVGLFRTDWMACNPAILTGLFW